MKNDYYQIKLPKYFFAQNKIKAIFILVKEEDGKVLLKNIITYLNGNNKIIV
jgi:hypothetical protein